MGMPKAVCASCGKEYFGWALLEAIGSCDICGGLVVLGEEGEARPERKQEACLKHP